MTSLLTEDRYGIFLRELQNLRGPLRRRDLDATRHALVSACRHLFPLLPDDIVLLNPYISLDPEVVPLAAPLAENAIHAQIAREPARQSDVEALFSELLGSAPYKESRGLTAWLHDQPRVPHVFSVIDKQLMQRYLAAESALPTDAKYSFYVESLFTTHLWPQESAWVHVPHLSSAPRDAGPTLAAGLYFMSTGRRVRVDDVPPVLNALLAEFVALVLEESLHRDIQQRKRIQLAMPSIQALLGTLETARGYGQSLRRNLTLNPAEAVARFANCWEFFPKQDTPYFNTWTFRHRWDTEALVRRAWQDFRAQVSCILLAYVARELPRSISEAWTGDHPAQRVPLDQLNGIGELLSYDLNALLNADPPPMGSVDLFKFLRNCFHTPHKKSTGKLTPQLLALWCIENGVPVDDCKTLVTAISHFLVDTDALEFVEALCQEVASRENSHFETCNLTLNIELSQVRIGLSPVGGKLTNELSRLASQLALEELAGAEGSLQGLMAQHRSLLSTPPVLNETVWIALK